MPFEQAISASSPLLEEAWPLQSAADFRGTEILVVPVSQVLC